MQIVPESTSLRKLGVVCMHNCKEDALMTLIKRLTYAYSVLATIWLIWRGPGDTEGQGNELELLYLVITIWIILVFICKTIPDNRQRGDEQHH